MSDRFHESDQKMIRSVGVYTKSITEFKSRGNKTPIRYEAESDTLVTRYRVNGAFICSVHLRQVFNGTRQLPIELSITTEILKILKNMPSC